MEQSTIKLSKKLKNDLKKQMNHPGETYEIVIARLINIVSQQNKEELSQQTIKNLRKSLNDIEKGKVYSLEQVEKELGL